MAGNRSLGSKCAPRVLGEDFGVKSGSTVPISPLGNDPVLSQEGTAVQPVIAVPRMTPTNLTSTQLR